VNTNELQKILYKYIKKLGTLVCFEVAMPIKEKTNMGKGSERVDCLSYTISKKSKIWRCYELKVSVNDFYSKCKNSFHGHYNYYVLPFEVYEKVQKDIPSTVGVYVSDGIFIWNVKKATKQDLVLSHDRLLLNMAQALDREYRKFMTR
jgi:hypothetical protein